MATYSKKKLLAANASQIPEIAEAIRKDFEIDGFEVFIDTLMSGGKDISVTKGNLFKAVLGMRSALKITLTPRSDGVVFDANVGIFGQQAIPTIISVLFLWPVLITQIWGLVEQAELDDRALAAAERAISGGTSGSSGASSAFMDSSVGGAVKFCTACGAKLSSDAKFCHECGQKL